MTIFSVHMRREGHASTKKLWKKQNVSDGTTHPWDPVWIRARTVSFARTTKTKTKKRERLQWVTEDDRLSRLTIWFLHISYSPQSSCTRTKRHTPMHTKQEEERTSNGQYFFLVGTQRNLCTFMHTVLLYCVVRWFSSFSFSVLLRREVLGFVCFSFSVRFVSSSSWCFSASSAERNQRQPLFLSLCHFESDCPALYTSC